MDAPIPPRRRMTLADVMPLILEERPFELIDGELVEKAAPSSAHGAAQSKAGAVLDPYNRKPGGPRGPGGWWIMSELDIRYPQTDEVFRHDLCGYRRERCPERPVGFPVELRPDWAMEILSRSNARFDTVKKQRTLHAHEVPHYWLLDPDARTLTVLRHHPDGYLVVLAAQTGDVVRAEPLDAITIEIDELLGDT